MTMHAIPPALGSGLSNMDHLKGIVSELQGLRIDVVAGAAAATKHNVTSLRPEDTILAALVFTNAAAAAPVNDMANISISETMASGTVTLSSTGPLANESLAVGAYTYTFKAAPTELGHVKIGTTINDTAENLKLAINERENKRASGQNPKPAVIATRSGAVVTVTATEDGTAGNSIVLTESATNVAVSGSGTLTGGTATGGFTSTTNLTGKTVILCWYKK